MEIRKKIPALMLVLMSATMGVGFVHAAPQEKKAQAATAKVAKKSETKSATSKKASAKKNGRAKGAKASRHPRRVTTKADFAAKKTKAVELSRTENKRTAGRAAKLAQAVGAHGLASASASPIVYDAEKEPVDGLSFSSSVVLVQDAITGTSVLAKNPTLQAPVASITKLMTGYVILEEGLDLNEMITITSDDVDRIKGTRSRLEIGKQVSRRDLLHLALMSSENRAAAALGRAYPEGFGAFVAKMNAMAQQLGMTQTRFMDTTGLSAGNVSSAADLAKLVKAAVEHEMIREFSTDISDHFDVNRRESEETFRNTNALVRQGDWQIALQKTGYTTQAGRCLVMYAFVDDRPYVIVLLDAPGGSQRVSDANKIRRVLSSSSSAHGAEIRRAKAAAEDATAWPTGAAR